MPEIEHPGILCGRLNYTQQVNYLRRSVTSVNKDHSFQIGTLPEGALILSMKAYVKEPFNETKFKIGKEPSKNEYGEKEVKAAGVQDYAPTIDKIFVHDDQELTLYCTPDKTAENGRVDIVVEFLANL